MLRISLRPSWMLATLLAAIHAVATCCAFAFVPAAAWGIATGLLLVASLSWHLPRDALLRASDSVREVTLHDDGRAELLLRKGAELEGRVLGSTFVSVALIVINARLETGRVRSIVLLPDSASPEDRRRLRVWLRHAVRADGMRTAVPASDRFQ